MYKAFLVFVILLTLSPGVRGKPVTDRPLRLAILQFGNSPIARVISERFRVNLKSAEEFVISDAEMTAAAARGIGYSGSLNLSVTEARDLGAAIDADFYFIGDAQTLRRSSSQSPVYFEAYCSLFIISSRTGKLIDWNRITFQNISSALAEQQLTNRVESAELRQIYIDKLTRAAMEEHDRRAVIVDTNEPLLEAPDDEKAATAKGLQLPRPYRHLTPAYPESAASADAEGTVDVLVNVGADGEVGQIEIARWAGFGLDEITVATVRQMHFFPAQQNGLPIAMRVLLRYNFRKSQK